jgi:hypothetical protein
MVPCVGEGVVFLHRRVVWFTSENYPLANLIHIQKPRMTLRVFCFEMHRKLCLKNPNIYTAFWMRIAVFSAWNNFVFILCFELPVFDFFYYSFSIHALNAHRTLSFCSYRISPSFPCRQNQTFQISFSESFQNAYWHNGLPIKGKASFSIWECSYIWHNIRVIFIRGTSPKQH